MKSYPKNPLESGNSYQQAHNLANAFKVDYWDELHQPLLLIDDMVD